MNFAKSDIKQQKDNKFNFKFMYAEDFVYAPAINKAAEITSKKKCKILYVKGEENLRGFSASVAVEWNKTEGGILVGVMTMKSLHLYVFRKIGKFCVDKVFRNYLENILIS